MIDQKTIGAQIRKMRKAKGMTQEQLAEKAGVGITHISHIETGRTVPSLDIVICLINAFECSADELLGVEIKKDIAIRNNWLTELVEDCSSLEVKIIADMVVSLKETMRRLEIEKTENRK
ncbi:MAG: helix-turn-helix domain-containing protein [Lachnospiraceae bacterium]|jgi:transcriptional regulator with XRE-family HTH domain|nr:helix-turn-helix domain-containing protein [Lachnospiraceae bacterium]